MISKLPFDAADRLAVSPLTTFDYDHLDRPQTLTDPDNWGHPHIDSRGPLGGRLLGAEFPAG